MTVKQEIARLKKDIAHIRLQLSDPFFSEIARKIGLNMIAKKEAQILKLQNKQP